MAFEVRKINPLDLQPRKAIGVDLPFSGQSVFNSTYQTKDALKANLINFFLTETGERFLNPTLGTKLRSLLFDSLTEEKVRQIDFIIKEDLKLNFPKVEPVEISTTGIPDRNTVQFFLKYKVLETNIEDELAINFEQ